MASLRSQVTTPATLSFYDSLEKAVRPFTLADGQDTVRWYSCGPTVYDASHMGHARNYVTTDSLRRLLRDYFGYKVRYVQNVTDVDDKIIVKARHNLLFDRYKQTHLAEWTTEIEKIKAWWEAYKVRFLDHVSTDLQDWSHDVPCPRDINAFPKDQMAIDTLTLSSKVLNNPHVRTMSADQALDSLRDIIILGIDKPDQSITNDDIVKSSKELTRYWEDRFDEDMDNLNVLRPDKVVRVTDYMKEIISFVQTIINNGFAYEANGSVYFNVAHFISSGHDYAKLKPSSMSSLTDALLAEAEGSLSAQISSSKQSQRDFALWKASKIGEPYWPSPWGEGRPGWHIECSAMASCEFGSSMDIHSGGEDLTFPHHDNELAQSEAAHHCHEWVRYFLHMGHLHIHGMKMSKSLKNFITIEQVLTTEGMTSRTMRLLFLSGRWRGRVDYNDDLIKGVRSTEQKFSEYFTQVRALAQRSEKEDTLAIENSVLNEKLQSARDAVDAALADDFDTPQMLAVLRELLSAANKALSDITPPLATLLQVTEYFTHLFEIVGIEAAEDRIGWAVKLHSSALMDEVQTVAELRQRIRSVAITSKADRLQASLSTLLDEFRDLSLTTPALVDFRSSFISLTGGTVSTDAIMENLDRFRDYTLVDLGIALDDKKDSFILKSGDRNDLIAKRDQKSKEQQDKASKKREAAQREREAMERGRVRARDMFKSEGGQYSQFDDAGVPTHMRDAQGIEVEVSKSLRKKMIKDHAAQEKLNRKYDAWELTQ